MFYLKGSSAILEKFALNHVLIPYKWSMERIGIKNFALELGFRSLRKMDQTDHFTEIKI